MQREHFDESDFSGEDHRGFEHRLDLRDEAKGFSSQELANLKSISNQSESKVIPDSLSCASVSSQSRRSRG